MTIPFRFLLLLATFLGTLPLPADDAALAAQIEAAGGKITRQGGVPTQVSFTDCARLGEQEFRALGQLASLKSLTLYGGKHKLTDETVVHLLGLKNLESFSSEGAWLSDASLARLAELTRLRSVAFFHLSFRMPDFTGQGFASWKALPRLERLTVAGMSMGDEGFAAIAQLTTLRELRTWHTYQTEAGNEEIAKLPQLTSLVIGQRLPRPGAPPSFTNATLATLARMQTLERLKLTEAHLSFNALRSLKALPKLKLLQIAECDVSAADLEALRTELLTVQIEMQPLTDEQRKKLEMYLR